MKTVVFTTKTVVFIARRFVMVYTDAVHVKAVQTAINAEGYSPPLVEDGIIGPKTTAGVKWFQQRHGLTVDGLIGPQTMAATIAPTPAQAAAPTPSPIAALQSQLAAIASAPPSAPPPLPAVSPPLVSQPVVALAGPPPAPSVFAAPRPVATAAMAHPLAPPPSGFDPNAPWVPPAAGALIAGGLGIGFKGWPLGGLIGAGVGLVLGLGYELLFPSTSMHGEGGYEYFLEEGLDTDYGLREGLSDPTIVAGDLGLPSSVGTMMHG